MKQNSLGASPQAAKPALVASLPEPVPVSAHSGDGQARERLAAFFEWWAADQKGIAYGKQDHEQHMEFFHRSEALADAARAIREGDDLRWEPPAQAPSPEDKAQ